jgi:hypothetical protein
VAYLDSTSATGNTTTPNVAVPTGVAAGDIVILAATIDSTTAAFDTGDWPTGFTELAEARPTADTQQIAVGWKRLTGADAGSYTFGAVDSGARPWVCQAFAFTGRHATDPPVISTSAVNNTANASPVTITANGVTAVAGDDLLMISGPDVTSDNGGNGHTAPASYTEREDAELSWSNLAGFSRDNVSAGATGTVSATFVTSAGNSGWAAWLVRIPAAAGGGAATSRPVFRRPLRFVTRRQ